MINNLYMFLEVAYPTKTKTKTTDAAPPTPDYQHEMQPHWKKACPPGNQDAAQNDPPKSCNFRQGGSLPPPDPEITNSRGGGDPFEGQFPNGGERFWGSISK